MAGRKEPQKLNLSREVTGLILLALGIFMGLVFFWPHSRSGALGGAPRAHHRPVSHHQ